MKKSYWIGFSLLEISYWCYHASFIGFLMSYLMSKGITNTMVSIFMASFLLASFVGSFFWGMVCDRFRTNRKVSVACFLIAGAAMYLIYFSYDSIPLLAVLYPLIGFVSLPHATNIDSWLLLACGNNLSVFGKIRCLPSLFYAVTSFVLGRMIAGYGYSMMLVFGTIALLMGIAAACILPEGRKAVQDSREDKAEVKESFNIHSLEQVLASASYRYLILILFLVGLAVAPVNNLKAPILEKVGGNVSDLGVDAFICAVVQVPFIALADRIERYSLRLRYLLLACLPFLTLLLAFYAVSPVMIFAGSFLYNMGVGILIPTMRSVTERNVAPAFRNLGHNIADAVYSSLTGIISLLYSGLVMDLYGMRSLLMICILVVLIPFVMTGSKLFCRMPNPCCCDRERCRGR
ncbi:hypothetical protein C817_03548 [Dorea sp. 5-2]|nr:hypothetical protein C817_03548 [Dorea sp. 5-2]